MTKNTIEVNQLAKSYGSKQALNNISFKVREGSCFGLLGPNGAGKSTTMKILSGLLDADTGTVSMFGQGIRKAGNAVKDRLGYVPQSITLYEKLSAYDNLQFFGEMYGVQSASLKRRIGEVLEQVGLADRAKDAITTFSGGMKRRVNIAAALLHRPKLIIMDEPTVGIDPQSRNHIFEMIRTLKNDGVTILYSTHYMEEVEALCDDLTIIDHGQVIAQGELIEVLDRFGTQAVYLELQDGQRPPSLPGSGAPAQKGRGWLLETTNPLSILSQWAQACQSASLQVKQLEIVRPTLEAVFLSLTGTTLRDN
ncbi:ABC transporter ATP-binding protein [Cohnella silvisoli]|uniref:ABC transporter ATP-binding protein n=1 Tax=Cohnella silvisoli TaxID=2873699 RepID=A0ABV1KSZ4_9BACL|nr:ABC transporter ATP-binding protein [Cohnella silvisoli]MCD9021417.1 ABC transporter ATP-binding protein [Cohnella silvisoli]